MKKWLKRIMLLTLTVVVITGITTWWMLRGSLPKLDGRLALQGLSAPVTVQRDNLGVVTIDAANETDAMRALGYVHAQERFFEMDLMRRSAAGELSELFGSIAIKKDKEIRVHRMRARALRHLDKITAGKQAQLQAYTDGVNAGLQGLHARPWPYLLLRQLPRPWEPVDSALTGYAMYFDLQDSNNSHELQMWKLKPHLPPELFALLSRDGTRWDAPLMGDARGDATLPTPEQVDLRKLATPDSGKAESVADDIVPGSNNFAVAGTLTRDGRAIVADDMHLGLRAPNIWFRARLRYLDARAPAGKVDVTGFTLPGMPAVIVGSNGYVAWGFTNSYGDWADWGEVESIETKSNCDAAATETGNNASATDRDAIHLACEIIHVAGAESVMFPVKETNWGPILLEENGRGLALRWVAHHPESLRMSFSDMALISDLDAAQQLADRTAIPAQNLLLADRSGKIAWRLLAPVPKRSSTACDAATVSKVVISDALAQSLDKPVVTGCNSSDSWTADPSLGPRINSPTSGRLWTANNRTLDGSELKLVGNGGYAFGARAKQIRDDLFAKSMFTERDLLAIQLDDRALLIQEWWRLLQDAAKNQAKAPTPSLKALAKTAHATPERASTDSVAYRIVRAWRLAVHARIADGLTAPARAKLGDDFKMPAFQQLEGVAWPLVTQRPAHLLPRRFSSWDALLEDAAKEVHDELAAQGSLAQRTWGERNTAEICHPLAKAIPLIGKRALCMPRDQLNGDGAMPRVASPSFGASERMVVSPGHEADGITHMPGGQSGHPLSPFWGAGHDDWVHGKPTPFLPGKTQHTLTLNPKP